MVFQGGREGGVCVWGGDQQQAPFMRADGCAEARPDHNAGDERMRECPTAAM